MAEFKPTQNKMICNRASECTLECQDRYIHVLFDYCHRPCERKGGISEAVCIPIPLTGAELIADERRRQIEVEGWKPERDDKVHSKGDLSLAGMCYIADYLGTLDNPEGDTLGFYRQYAQLSWPWDYEWWKPTPNDPIRQLVKAGALIAAEIDRLQRMENK
jgi:hypothetical protein